MLIELHQPLSFNSLLIFCLFPLIELYIGIAKKTTSDRFIFNLDLFFFVDGSEKLSDNSPGAASISSVDIANEFAGLSSEEQERVRAEWSQVREKETPYLIIYAQN